MSGYVFIYMFLCEGQSTYGPQQSGKIADRCQDSCLGIFDRVHEVLNSKKEVVNFFYLIRVSPFCCKLKSTALYNVTTLSKGLNRLLERHGRLPRHVLGGTCSS